MADKDKEMEIGVDKRWMKALATGALDKPREFSTSELKEMSGARKPQSKIQAIMQNFYYELQDRLREIRMESGRVVGPDEDMFDGWYEEQELGSYNGRYNLMQFFNALAKRLSLEAVEGYSKEEFDKVISDIAIRCRDEPEYVDVVKTAVNEKYPGLIGDFRYSPSLEAMNEQELQEHERLRLEIEQRIESNVEEFADIRAKIEVAKKTSFQRTAQILDQVVIAGDAIWELILYGAMSPFAPRILINNLEYRANIHEMLAGDISTAKSVEGATPIQIASVNGCANKTIAEIVDGALRNASRIYREGDTEWTTENPEKLETYILNPETFKIEWGIIEGFIRHKSPKKLYKIRTKTGRQLTGTKKHSYLVLNEQGLLEKEIEIGDFIPVPRRLPMQGQTIDQLDINIYALNNKRTRRLPSIELDRETGFFIGQFLAEGYPGIRETTGYVQISTDTEAYQIRLREWGKSLGFFFTGKRDSVITLSSLILARFLDDTCYHGKKIGSGKGSGSRRKKVPDFAYNAPNEFREGLLEGYFKGDGSKEQTKWNKDMRLQTAVSSSKKLIHGISTLLAMQDKPTTLPLRWTTYKGERRRYYGLTIPSSEVSKSYWDLVPYGASKLYPLGIKLGLNQRITGNRFLMADLRNIRNRQGDRITRPFFEKTIEYLKIRGWQPTQDIMRFVDPDIIWDEVMEIQEVEGTGYVYDLSTKHENFMAGYGNMITHNSKVLKILGLIAPKAVPLDEVTKPTFEGVAPTKSGEEIEEGFLDWAKDGIVLIEEFTRRHATMPLWRKGMDCETYAVYKKGSSKVRSVNTTWIVACNPSADFFQTELEFRKQLPFKEGVLSRFDVLVPLTATQDKNDMIVEKMDIFGTKAEDIDFEAIKVTLETIAAGMMDIKRVFLTEEQKQTLRDVFKEQNDRDRRKRILKNRPLVIMRDLETLARFVNTIATVNFPRRTVNKRGVLKASNEDIDKAIQLWENLLQFRVQLYADSDRNLKTISDEICLFIWNESRGQGSNQEVSIESVYREIVMNQRLVGKSTFYKEIGNLVETGRLAKLGQRNSMLKLIIR